MSKSKLLAAALALAHLTCASVPLTAPSGSSLTLNVNPTFVAANGGVSAVTAILVEPAGTFVPDGTVVFFLTDLGRIEPQVKTKNGFAYANFVSDSRSGTAHDPAHYGIVLLSEEPEVLMEIPAHILAKFVEPRPKHRLRFQVGIVSHVPED